MMGLRLARIVPCAAVFLTVFASWPFGASADLDVFSAVYNGGNRVWLNNGGANFLDSGQSLGAGQSLDVALGDLDGDGDLDAFVANYAQPNEVWLNDGNGNFSDSGQSLGNYGSRRVALGDVDGDNDLDAVLANDADPDVIWLNDGNATFSRSNQILDSGIRSMGLALGDVDGDSDLDIYVAYRQEYNRIWYNDGAGNFTRSSLYFGGNRSSVNVNLGDVDGDGDLDALDVGFNTVLLNDGTGDFSVLSQNLYTGSRGWSAGFGDLDGDGDLDVFLIHEWQAGEPHKVWINDGTGNFSDTGTISPLDAGGGTVSLGDLDGDGDLDAFVARCCDNGVWLNDGSGNFVRSSRVDHGFASQAEALGDLDGDGERSETIMVSVDSYGTFGNSTSDAPSISADGRYVAFHSFADNLVPGDTNGADDVFVHDRVTGKTVRVSVASDDSQGSTDSKDASISGDGRLVAFRSVANDLVADDRGNSDIFVHNLDTGETEIVSVASDGTYGSDDSFRPFISADGNFVTFYSFATNLVEDDNNGMSDVFVHNRGTGKTEIVSLSSTGVQGNHHSRESVISEDGRYVAFRSFASNLVDGDTNSGSGLDDIFVHDRVTHETNIVSVNSYGVQANNHSLEPSISADGKFIAFYSRADNLVAGDTNNEFDVFVHDRIASTTERVSVASGGAAEGNGSAFIHFGQNLSADGRFVAFYSAASNLLAPDIDTTFDVFIHDRETKTTEVVSIASDGSQGYGGDVVPAINADGCVVAFASNSSNLVDGDTVNAVDVFVRERATPGICGNRSPTAVAGPDQSIRVGDTVVLDGGASYDDNTPSALLSYSWSFVSRPEGSSATLVDPDTPAPSFVVDVNGTYVVQLAVTDEGGLSSAPDEVQVSSDNLAPVAEAGDNQLVIIGDTVFLDGSASSDPENDPLTYAWTVTAAPAGSLALLNDADTPFPIFVPDLAGLYVITLDVSDFIGLGTPDNVEITVTTAEDFAVIHIVEDSQVVESLPADQITNEGNREALLSFLSLAVLAIDMDNSIMASKQLENAIVRFDGCALRGTPDGTGQGMDWITDCDAQIEAYDLLTAALDALTL